MEWLWLLEFLLVALECDVPILEAVWFGNNKECMLFNAIVTLVKPLLLSRKINCYGEWPGCTEYVSTRPITGVYVRRLIFDLNRYVISVLPQGDFHWTYFWVQWKEGRPHFFVDYPEEKFINPVELTNGYETFNVYNRAMLSQRSFPTTDSIEWIAEMFEILDHDRRFINED